MSETYLTTDKPPFTEAELDWLRDVENGADVWGYEPAMFLRSVSRLSVPLVVITKPMRAPRDGAARQPYFGAILTDAGRTAIAAARGAKA